MRRSTINSFEPDADMPHVLPGHSCIDANTEGLQFDFWETTASYVVEEERGQLYCAFVSD
jgi:hypothetical protein